MNSYISLGRKLKSAGNVNHHMYCLHLSHTVGSIWCERSINNIVTCSAPKPTHPPLQPIRFKQLSMAKRWQKHVADAHCRTFIVGALPDRKSFPLLAFKSWFCFSLLISMISCGSPSHLNCWFVSDSEMMGILTWQVILFFTSPLHPSAMPVNI